MWCRYQIFNLRNVQVITTWNFNTSFHLINCIFGIYSQNIWNSTCRIKRLTLWLFLNIDLECGCYYVHNRIWGFVSKKCWRAYCWNVCVCLGCRFTKSFDCDHYLSTKLWWCWEQRLYGHEATWLHKCIQDNYMQSLWNVEKHCTWSTTHQSL